MAPTINDKNRITETVSCVQWSHASANTFFASCWDGSVYAYQVVMAGAPSLKQLGAVKLPAPSLSLTAPKGAPGHMCMASSANDLYNIDFQTRVPTKIGSTTAPIHTVRWMASKNACLTVDLGQKAALWDIRTPGKPVLHWQLPGHCSAADATDSAFVVCGKARGTSGANTKMELNVYLPTSQNPVSTIPLASRMPATSVISSPDDMLWHSLHEDGSLCTTRNVSKQCPAFTQHGGDPVSQKVKVGSATVQGRRKVFRANCGAWDQPSHTLLVGCSSGQATPWDTLRRNQSKMLIGETTRLSPPITAMAYNAACDQLLYATGEDWAQGRHRQRMFTPQLHVRKVLRDTQGKPS
eukprot:gnl/Dysnectes_brevis/4230_a5599_614.p1 GENE.gnl/Dysnectes_brevis/4230_a5599_614~~gnl/Dysnectes_brevis/4230_a5599_614.p1  ORF type:complete len:353 (+),score=70.92 gnl/Dysnectes_brevis/4230_a5599_614:75-1133(+)